MDRLGLGIYTRRLRALNDGFRNALLARDADPAVSFEEVRAARDLAQNNYVAIAARITGVYCDAADAELRSELLAPIMEQNDELRAYRRRRRRPVDIDADTGKLLPDDSGDSDDSDDSDDSAEPATKPA
jgi:hypothetical protein